MFTSPDYALVGIETRFLGPTDTRGSRVKALRSDHRAGDPTVTVSWDHALDSFANHAAAAAALDEKLGWSGDYVAAATERGYVFARSIAK